MCVWCKTHFFILDAHQKSARTKGIHDLIYFCDPQTSIFTCLSISVPSPYLQLSDWLVHSESTEQFTVKAQLSIISFRPPSSSPHCQLLPLCFFHQEQTRTSTHLDKLEHWGGILGPSHSAFSVSKFYFIRMYFCIYLFIFNWRIIAL